MDILGSIEHILLHSLEDTAYLVPFLLVTYLLMEWLEHKTGERAQESIRRAGVAGPVVGSILGVVPQCGFSAAAATLYAGRVVTLGTLFAVFLSTSDEMLPIFLAEQVPLPTIAKILGAKILVGMVMGFVVDAAVHIARREAKAFRIHELCEQSHCQCNGRCEACELQPELAYDHENDHEHHHDHSGASIFKSAVIHTIQVTLFIFAITLVLNAILVFIGEDALARFLGQNELLSIMGAALVGLIPNCAASVVIAQLYVDGALGAGAMFAGLLASAGVGLLVLFRTNRRPGDNLIILAGLFAMAIFWGLLVMLFGISF